MIAGANFLVKINVPKLVLYKMVFQLTMQYTNQRRNVLIQGSNIL